MRKITITTRGLMLQYERQHNLKYNSAIPELAHHVNRTVADLVSTRIKTQKGWPLTKNEVI